jgi:cyanate lyase
MRAAGVTMPSTDPLIYRFYELVMGEPVLWRKRHKPKGCGVLTWRRV